MCVELMNLKMEVSNILEIEVYELSEEGKVPLIKNWLGWEVLQLTHAYPGRGREIQECKGPLHSGTGHAP